MQNFAKFCIFQPFIFHVSCSAQMSDLQSLPRVAAHLLAGLTSVSYVFSLYVARFGSRNRDIRWRNNPRVVKSRLLGATVSATAWCIILWGVLWIQKEVETLQFRDACHSDQSLVQSSPLGSTLLLLGIRSAPLSSHLLVPFLFLGPLYAMYLRGALPVMRNWDTRREFGILRDWIGIRNFVVVGEFRARTRISDPRSPRHAPIFKSRHQ